ncbi:MAG: hypothetical protein GC180_09590 [Bacteroidetes bacterium]|nr:hypothetical protein [Bacteroidota bacterium]
MKYAILLMSTLFISSCALLKKKQCTEINLGTPNVFMTQVTPDAGMYIFKITEGELNQTELHLNIQIETGDKDAFIIKMGEEPKSKMIHKEAWVWKQKVNEEKMEVSATGQIQLDYAGKVYCFNLTYEGSSMKMPMPEGAPPEAPREMPH